jgi:hypothetical protein
MAKNDHIKHQKKCSKHGNTPRAHARRSENNQNKQTARKAGDSVRKLLTEGASTAAIIRVVTAAKKTMTLEQDLRTQRATERHQQAVELLQAQGQNL